MRVAMIRTGILLDKAGGALGQMLPPFKLGLGGPVAGGKQYMPWIHADDVVGLYLLALDNGSATGPINATAPEPVTNKVFTKALGRAIHRPTIAPIPTAALKLRFGEMAQSSSPARTRCPSGPASSATGSPTRNSTRRSKARSPSSGSASTSSSRACRRPPGRRPRASRLARPPAPARARARSPRRRQRPHRPRRRHRRRPVRAAERAHAPGARRRHARSRPRSACAGAATACACAIRRARPWAERTAR